MKKSLLITLLCLLATAMQAQFTLHVFQKNGGHSVFRVNDIDSIAFINMQDGAAGSGTVEDPYNVAAALKIGSTLQGEQQTAPVYIKGFVVSRNTIDQSTGQRGYYLSDDLQLPNMLQVYRGYSYDGQGFTDEDEIQYGDVVVVYGAIGLYQGTAEVMAGSSIYSINGMKKDEFILPTGTGTKADPFNVKAALAKCKEVGETGTTTEVYVKGFITELTEVSTAYGNAIFKIADKKDGRETLYVYRAKGFKGENITDENFLHVGDSVVIYGKLVNYKGVTPEFTQGCYIVSLNGQGDEGGDEQAGSNDVGTKDAPKTVAEALTAINALNDGATTEVQWYIKGKVKTVKTSDENIGKYKNIDYTIVDEGASDELTVFRGKYLDNADFTIDNKVKEGDEVIVYGKLQKYVKNDTTTPEVAQGNYLVSVKKAN